MFCICRSSAAAVPSKSESTPVKSGSTLVKSPMFSAIAASHAALSSGVKFAATAASASSTETSTISRPPGNDVGIVLWMLSGSLPKMLNLGNNEGSMFDPWLGMSLVFDSLA